MITFTVRVSQMAATPLGLLPARPLIDLVCNDCHQRVLSDAGRPGQLQTLDSAALSHAATHDPSIGAS